MKTTKIIVEISLSDLERKLMKGNSYRFGEWLYQNKGRKILLAKEGDKVTKEKIDILYKRAKQDKNLKSILVYKP